MTRLTAWRTIALVLLIASASCSDFSQHRLGGVRNREFADGPPPKPDPALHIPNPPSLASNTGDKIDPNLKKATFIPDREAPLDPKGQGAQHPLRVLHERASQQQKTMGSYIFRLRRREVVDGKKMPEELIKISVRPEPYAVHLKWLGAEGKGREVVYVKGKFDNKMQILLASNDAFPFSPAGLRWSIAADDPSARAKSRHPITNTGLGNLITSYGQLISAVEKGDTRLGIAKYLGKVKRPEFEAQVETVHQVLPAMSDPNLPKGGERWWYFDAASGLPVLIVTHDSTGEVEYYCHEHIQLRVQLDDADFNPDALWRKKSN